MFKILTTKTYNKLKNQQKGNEFAEMYSYAKDNNFEGFYFGAWRNFAPSISCEYKGVKLEKVTSLEQMQSLKKLKDQLDVTKVE